MPQPEPPTAAAAQALEDVALLGDQPLTWLPHLNSACCRLSCEVGEAIARLPHLLQDLAEHVDDSGAPASPAG